VATSPSKCLTLGCVKKGIELLEFMTLIMLYIRPNILEKLGYALDQINLKNGL
jgi:hypothetical protein